MEKRFAVSSSGSEVANRAPSGILGNPMIIIIDDFSL